MDNKSYINPGIIESYCLGLLTPAERAEVKQAAEHYPEVKNEINDFMLTMEQYALNNAVKPGESVKQKTLALLENLKLEHAANIHDLPLLNKYSDHRNWLSIVKELLPENLDAGMYVHTLRNDADVSQTLIWTPVDYPDEVHDNEHECFIILEGRCRCYIEGEIIELGPGGFLEIPMYKHHDVRVLENVLAVVQRVRVA